VLLVFTAAIHPKVFAPGSSTDRHMLVLAVMTWITVAATWQLDAAAMQPAAVHG
jgi:hypothetical protein